MCSVTWGFESSRDKCSRLMPALSAASVKVFTVPATSASMAARTFAEIRIGLSVMGNGPDGRRIVAQVDDVAGAHLDVQTDARLGGRLDPGQTQDKGRRPVLDRGVLGIEQLDLCRAGTGGSDGERSSDLLLHELIDVRPAELAAEVFSAQPYLF